MGQKSIPKKYWLKMSSFVKRNEVLFFVTRIVVGVSGLSLMVFSMFLKEDYWPRGLLFFSWALLLGLYVILALLDLSDPLEIEESRSYSRKGFGISREVFYSSPFDKKSSVFEKKIQGILRGEIQNYSESEDFKTLVREQFKESSTDHIVGWVEDYLDPDGIDDDDDYEEINTRVRVLRTVLLDYRTKFLGYFEEQIKDVKRDRRNSLWVALAITAAIVIVLGYTIIEVGPIRTEIETSSFMLGLIPRFAFSILGGVFAFYFLRMYLGMTEKITYYQNERTNLGMRFLALEVAIITGNEQSMAELTKQLELTERNFILKKDESTVEIERGKNIADHTEALLSLFHSTLSNHGQNSSEKNKANSEK